MILCLVLQEALESGSNESSFLCALQRGGAASPPELRDKVGHRRKPLERCLEGFMKSTGIHIDFKLLNNVKVDTTSLHDLIGSSFYVPVAIASIQCWSGRSRSSDTEMQA